MKKTQRAEIKNLTLVQLLTKANEIRQQLSDLKLKKDGKDLKASFKKKKDLARILTVKHQKELVEILKEAK